ncbi:hypothetical protein BSKO_13220 [Bryopsis sp. KO-2023]|nr:hypothetical protein BSKO_13220 [Bryopsis sp. KO-2023]
MAGIVGASQWLTNQYRQRWSIRFLDAAWHHGRKRLFPGPQTPASTTATTPNILSSAPSRESLDSTGDNAVQEGPSQTVCRKSERVNSTLFQTGIQTTGSDVARHARVGVQVLYDGTKKKFRFDERSMDRSTPFMERIREYIRRILVYKDIFTGECQEHESGEAIHPMSALRTSWDVLMLGLILVLCVVAPFRIGFDIRSSPILDVFDLTCDLLLTLDILLNFFTGFVDKNETHLEIRKVAQQYLRFWFWADIASTLPVSQMMKLGILPQNQFILTLKLLRVIRLFRMLKVARLMNRLKWWVMIRFSVRSIIKFLLIILMVAHWNTCLWCLMSRWGNAEDTWAGVAQINIEAIPWPKLYLICFYWAITTMTTIGYGDIRPVTDPEKVLTLLVMCTGSCCYAYGITQIVTIVSNLNMADVFYHAQVDNLHEYIERRGLPKSLNHRILEFYDFKRHHSGVFFNEREILKDLPHSLRAEVVMHISDDISKKVAKIPLFADLEERFMDSIMVRMKYTPYPPGETVVMEGEVGTRMYFINKGLLQVSVHGCTVATLKSGNFFGEVALYHNKGRRTATVETLTYCEICSLQRKDVEEALGPYPNITKLIRERAKSLWGKHHSENEQKIHRTLSQSLNACKEVRVSMVATNRKGGAAAPDMNDGLFASNNDEDDEGMFIPSRPAIERESTENTEISIPRTTTDASEESYLVNDESNRRTEVYNKQFLGEMEDLDVKLEFVLETLAASKL